MTRRRATSKPRCSGVLIASLYAPNGNPQPGPKFAYKLAWLDRLARACRRAFRHRRAGGARRRLQCRADRSRHLSDQILRRRTRCCSPRAARAFSACSTQGWVDAIRTLHPDAPMYTFWDYLRNRWPRDAGLRIDHLLLSSAGREAAGRLPASIARCAARKMPATMRRPGWSCASRPSSRTAGRSPASARARG